MYSMEGEWCGVPRHTRTLLNTMRRVTTSVHSLAVCHSLAQLVYCSEYSDADTIHDHPDEPCRLH